MVFCDMKVIRRSVKLRTSLLLLSQNRFFLKNLPDARRQNGGGQWGW